MLSTSASANASIVKRGAFAEARVAALSKGKLGYIHIKRMDEAGLDAFVRALYSDCMDKEAKWGYLGTHLKFFMDIQDGNFP